jgi:NADH-quinone oxidoreductase subunit C
VKSSSVQYQAEAPAGVSAAAKAALAPFGPRWSFHHRTVGVLVPAERWLEAFQALKAAGFDFLVDHTAVDYPERSPRFTVVAVVMSLATQERLVVKARLAEGASIASLTPLWASANWAERETYDMFGIDFAGHPELTRIYMPHDYEGWPMRKDFPLQGHLRFRD